MGLVERARAAYNAFRNGEENIREWRNFGPAYSERPDRSRLSYQSYRSIIAAIYNRIAVDVSGIRINHVRVNEEGLYESIIDSDLNWCLSVEANIDQNSRAFLRDFVISLFDEGVVAIIPTGGSMRVAKIVEWFPQYVRFRGYNERSGQFEEGLISKRDCAIVENPFYETMNEPNGTLKRLARKFTLLDKQDEEIGSGKIDLVVQLPYKVHSPVQQQEVKARRKDVENQLRGSKYGIAYFDATERITQLNRPVENHFVDETKDLTLRLYNEMGISESILNGTATEEQENNYHSKTLDPIVSTLCLELERKFLTRTAKSQGQRIMYFRDPFRLMPAKELAETADKLTRNEILSSNEVRSIIGYKPSSDPRADMLINKNLRQPEDDQNGSKDKEEENET